MGVVENRGEGIEQLGSAAPAARSAAGPAAVETEVAVKAQRRRFTAEYKRRIVREAVKRV